MTRLGVCLAIALLPLACGDDDDDGLPHSPRGGAPAVEAGAGGALDAGGGGRRAADGGAAGSGGAAGAGGAPPESASGSGGTAGSSGSGGVATPEAGSAGALGESTWHCATAAGVCSCVPQPASSLGAVCVDSSCCFLDRDQRCHCREPGSPASCEQLQAVFGAEQLVTRCPPPVAE